MGVNGGPLLAQSKGLDVEDGLEGVCDLGGPLECSVGIVECSSGYFGRWGWLGHTAKLPLEGGLFGDGTAPGSLEGADIVINRGNLCIEGGELFFECHVMHGGGAI